MVRGCLIAVILTIAGSILISIALGPEFSGSLGALFSLMLLGGGGYLVWRLLVEIQRRERERRRREEEERQRILGHPGLAVAEPEPSEVALTWAFGMRDEFHDARVTVADRTAYVDLTAPENRVATIRTEWRKTRRGSAPVERARPQREVNEEYKDVVAGHARQAVDLAFNAVPGLERVVVSLYRTMVHETLGHYYQGCVLSAMVDRAKWSTIAHERVSAENALRNSPLRFQYDRYFKIREVIAFGRPGVGGALDEAVPLEQMDPLEFESLVRDLLHAMGYQATLTKASHDGGIDVEAFNPQPIAGGKLIVQCKRYGGTVGASAVRDLYGVVTAGQAKGVLIMTSDFSTDARQFAEGKQLELINGQQLRGLLRQYGLLAEGRGPGKDPEQ